MTPEIDIAIEDPRWDRIDLTALAARAAGATLAHLGLPGADHEISFLACDDARIAGLNGQFRDKPAPTNVLSWPSVDLTPDTDGATPEYAAAMPELGDIALAWDTCLREAEGLGIAPEDHVFHLIVHGILHLLGHDHIRDKDAALMEALEVAILAENGIADPYRLTGMPQPDDGK